MDSIIEKLMMFFVALLTCFGVGIIGYQLSHIETITKIETLEKTCRNVDFKN